MALISPEIRAADSIEVPKQAKKQMLKVSVTPSGTKVWINSSSLSLLQQCPRKAHYTLFRGLVGKHGSPATIYGTAIHAALEEFYRGAQSERVMPRSFKQNMELMGSGEVLNQEDDYLLYRATRTFIDKASPLQVLPGTDKRSISTGVWTLTHYFQTYIDDPYEIFVLDGEPLVEKTVEIPVHSEAGLEIILFGTIDAILVNPTSGQILVTDHKTSSVVGKDFYNRLKPNFQYSAYIYLAQQALGIETSDFMVNCIQVKPKPKTAKGLPPHFPRQITKRTEEDVEDLKKVIVYNVKNYLGWIKDDHWPQGDVNVCSFYGGCQYLDVCSSPNAIRENIIKAKYEEN